MKLSLDLVGHRANMVGYDYPWPRRIYPRPPFFWVSAAGGAYENRHLGEQRACLRVGREADSPPFKQRQPLFNLRFMYALII